jgi:hypothetical protein
VSKFGLDLYIFYLLTPSTSYGFDKYVIFVPASSIEGIIFGSASKDHEKKVDWKEWKPSTFSSAVDGLEKRVRGFGGGAKETPIFIPELQGGWFNHYSVEYTYDKVVSLPYARFTIFMASLTRRPSSTAFSRKDRLCGQSTCSMGAQTGVLLEILMSM